RGTPCLVSALFARGAASSASCDLRVACGDQVLLKGAPSECSLMEHERQLEIAATVEGGDCNGRIEFKVSSRSGRAHFLVWDLEDVRHPIATQNVELVMRRLSLPVEAPEE